MSKLVFDYDNFKFVKINSKEDKKDREIKNKKSYTKDIEKDTMCYQNQNGKEVIMNEIENKKQRDLKIKTLQNRINELEKEKTTCKDKERLNRIEQELYTYRQEISIFIGKTLGFMTGGAVSVIAAQIAFYSHQNIIGFACLIVTVGFVAGLWKFLDRIE